MKCSSSARKKRRAHDIYNTSLEINCYAQLLRRAVSSRFASNSAARDAWLALMLKAISRKISLLLCLRSCSACRKKLMVDPLFLEGFSEAVHSKREARPGYSSPQPTSSIFPGPFPDTLSKVKFDDARNLAQFRPSCLLLCSRAEEDWHAFQASTPACSSRSEDSEVQDSTCPLDDRTRCASSQI